MSYIDEANVLRGRWAKGDSERDSKIPMPCEIEEITNVEYVNTDAEDKTWHLADFYYPKNNEDKKLPTIVSVHGGGWFYGDKELYSRYTKHLAQQGFAVVNFNYRLAPENKYPSGFSDVCELMCFIKKNADEYRLDMDRLYMVGDSAGAQLVAQYCVFATSEQYRKLLPSIENLSVPVPRKVALNCGVYKVDARDDDICMKWYLPESMDKATCESICNYLEYINSSYPESFVMVSVNDGLTPCSKDIIEKFIEKMVPYVYKEYGKKDKSAGHVFHIDIISEEAIDCNTEQISFFRD